MYFLALFILLVLCAWVASRIPRLGNKNIKFFFIVVTVAVLLLAILALFSYAPQKFDAIAVLCTLIFTIVLGIYFTARRR